MEAARTTMPNPGFLEGVRKLTAEHNIILIFDEVVTGFRTARGGAQQHFGVIPDMATFAKSISNGFALGAVAGKREIMRIALDSFISSVYWAEATGLAAGKATLKEYLKQDVWETVKGLGEVFLQGIRKLIQEFALPIKVAGFPSYSFFLFEGVSSQHRDQLVTLYKQETAKRGLYGGPGHCFCLEHSESDLQQGLEIIGDVFEVIRKALNDGDLTKFLQCPVRQSTFQRMV
jgi:glutamate-1-semialdehyde 2,1-aminomutase